jgi:predicted ester cyclase
MSLEENKSLVRRYIAEVWHTTGTVTVDRFFAANYKRYLSPTAEPLNLDGQRQRITGLREAFPDLHFTIEDLIAEGDRVVFRSTIRGTHRGAFQGIPPTGRRVTVGLIDIVRVEDGRFVEHWGGPDLFDLLRQLGATVSPPTPVP